MLTFAQAIRICESYYAVDPRFEVTLTRNSETSVTLRYHLQGHDDQNYRVSPLRGSRLYGAWRLER